MIAKIGWTLFLALFVFNLVAFASYEWSMADVARRRISLVDIACEQIPFTAEERVILEALEQDVRGKRMELIERGKSIIPEVRSIFLAPVLDEDRMAAIFSERMPDRVAYLRYENRRLHETLKQLPSGKREQLLDFLINLRVGEMGKWAENKGEANVFGSDGR